MDTCSFASRQKETATGHMVKVTMTPCIFSMSIAPLNMLAVVMKTKILLNAMYLYAWIALNYVVQYNSRIVACTIELWGHVPVGVMALIVLRIKDSWYPATSIASN